MSTQTLPDMLFAIALASGRYSHPLSLARYAAQVYSQNGEDGMIAEAFRRIGTTNRVFVEIGVESGQQTNTRFLLEQGWTGVWVDADAGKLAEARTVFGAFLSSGALSIIEAAVTAESVNGLLQDIGLPDRIDFLSLDIDQNTSHVWRALRRPARVACIEYNAAIPPTVAIEVPYDPAQSWNRSNWYGASLAAIHGIGIKKGMHLVGCDLNGVNAFFVDGMLTADRFQAPFTAAAHYEPLRLDSVRPYGHMPSGVAHRWIARAG
jgi:hypothetical protein